MNLEEILEIENDPAFVEVVCPATGILVWPTIRNELLRLVIGDQLYRTAPLADLTPRYSARRIIAGAARAAAHNRTHPPRPSELLIVATGAGLIPRDGRSFNRYADYFADCLPGRSWTMESLSGGHWPPLPRANEQIGYLADRRLMRELEGRALCRSRHRNLVRELVEIAVSRGRSHLGWVLDDLRRARLIEIGARRLASYPGEARFASRLLGRVKPTLALVEEGCYGRMAVFNATARESGVTVAEFQHGMVTRGHDAYNAAPRLVSSEAYRLTQPTAFLAYGRWWSDQFNAPVEHRVILGHPHRSDALSDWRPEPGRRNVVVIGDGVETEASLDLCERLAALLPQPLRVIFRPHPREREQLRGERRGISIEVEPDLYRSLSGARAVIGEASTALFEAAGIVPSVLVWDTEKSRFYLGDHPFARFADPVEAAELLTAKGASTGRSSSLDEIWADDWRNRFLDFLATLRARLGA